MGSTTIEGLPEKAGPTALEAQDKKKKAKRKRQRDTLITGTILRVHGSQVVNSRQNLDVNQSN